MDWSYSWGLIPIYRCKLLAAKAGGTSGSPGCGPIHLGEVFIQRFLPGLNPLESAQLTRAISCITGKRRDF